MTSKVTIERLERGMALMAYIVARHGDKYAGQFAVLEDEHRRLKERDPSARAKRFLRDHSIEMPVKAIR